MSNNNKTGKKDGKRRNSSSSNSDVQKFSRMDYLGVVPGVLMCAVTLLMLLGDIAMPEMAQAQYQSYPALFRGADLVIAAAGIIYLCIYIVNTRKLDLNRSGTRKVSCIFFCLFIVCIILSTVVNGFDSKALHGISFRDIGVFNLISFVLIYMGLSSRIGAVSPNQLPDARSSASMQSTTSGSSHLRRFVLFFYIFVADLTALAAAIDKWIYPIPAFGEKKDISAIFFNGNHYGYFLVMAILLSAGLFLYSRGLKTRIFSACSMALNGFILALNGSTGCILAVSAALILTLAVTCTMRRDALKANLILLALLTAALAVVTLRTNMLQTLSSDVANILTESSDADSAGHNRWLLWTTTCGYITSKPILGYGCEGLSDILMETTGRADPHNEILSYAAQFGIPAAVFYTAGVIFSFISFFTNRQYCISDNGSDQHIGNLSSSKTCGSFSDGTGSSDETRAACFLASFGYFISSLFGVTMFYTLPFFFIFLGMSQDSSAKPE